MVLRLIGQFLQISVKLYDFPTKWTEDLAKWASLAGWGEGEWEETMVHCKAARWKHGMAWLGVVIMAPYLLVSPQNILVWRNHTEDNFEPCFSYSFNGVNNQTRGNGLIEPCCIIRREPSDIHYSLDEITAQVKSIVLSDSQLSDSYSIRFLFYQIPFLSDSFSIRLLFYQIHFLSESFSIKFTFYYIIIV